MDNKFDFTKFNNGKTDATEFIQNILSQGGNIDIPAGKYLISKTLLVPSNTTINASQSAIFIMNGNIPKHRGDFLLTNNDFENGNENITINGGIWDGNNSGKYNTKPDLFDKNGYSGTVLNFFNVENLTLKNFVVANSVTYNIRMSKINNFEITNIDFYSFKKAFNQDGLHFGGYCTNGVVNNIKAVSKGQTNDDLLALNADDSIERIENFDILRGPIENITFNNIYAEDCHTLIRLLSVYSPIRNITFNNIRGGFREYAINMDGARHCRTPLFDEKDYPNGCGIVENITINNMEFHSTKKPIIKNKNGACVICENLCDNVVFNNFTRNCERDCNPSRPTFLFRGVTNTNIISSGKSVKQIDNKQESYAFNNDYTDLIITKIK